MTRPMVVRSLASLTNDQPIPAVKVTKHSESPEVAVVTLTQSAFSHDTARLLIKVCTLVDNRNPEGDNRPLADYLDGLLFSSRTI